MFAKGVLHRDIKLENILIHNQQLKVADFGFCMIHDPN
jgi:serine/threonine protein kinase